MKFNTEQEAREYWLNLYDLSADTGMFNDWVDDNNVIWEQEDICTWMKRYNKKFSEDKMFSEDNI